MNIIFRNDISASCMVIEDVENFSTENFAVKILANNKIKGLLPMDHETINGRTNICFDVTGRQSLDSYYKSNKILFGDYKNIVYSLTEIIKNVKEYLLDTNNIILKKKYIFINSERQSIEFCYYPYYGEKITEGIRELFSSLLSMIDYGDPRVVRVAYDAQKSTVTETFTMDEIMTSISKAISDIDSSYAAFEQKNIKSVSAFNEETRDYNCEKKVEEKKENMENATFFEKAQMYFKGKDAGEVFDDINELKILKKIKNINVENEDESSKKTSDNKKDNGMGKNKSKKITSKKEEKPEEKKQTCDLPDGIAEMAEDINKSGFFEDYRML